MKLIPTLLLAASLTAGSAFAATTPTATPASTAKPAATSTKKEGMHCVKQAHEKKLTGDAEKAFVKECRAGKKPS